MAQARKDLPAVQLVVDDLIDLDHFDQNSLLKVPTLEAEALKKEVIATKVTNFYEKFAVGYALVAELLKLMGITLKSIPIISEAIDGIEILLGVAIAAYGAMRKDGKWRRRIKVAAGLSLIGIAIASLAAPEAALLIFIVSASIGFFQHIWNFGAALISRLRGSWKKEADKLKEDEADFYKLLANEPRGLEVLAQARKYASDEHQVEEQDNQIKEIQEEISPRKKSVPQPTLFDKSDEEFQRKLERSLADDTIHINLPGQDNEKSKEDFIDTLSGNEKRIIELDKKIHQRRQNLQERLSDKASDFVDFIAASVAVAGAALIFTPLAPIGGVMILCSVIFSVCRAFDVPAKWASRLSDYLFEPDKVESYESIQKKVPLVPGSENANKLALAKTHSTSMDLLKKFPANSVEPHVEAEKVARPIESKPSGFFSRFNFFKTKPASAKKLENDQTLGLGLH